MKLAIEKLPHGDVRVEVTTDTAKKPIVVELDRVRLDAARRAGRFSFTLEL
jgi:hypothetical protein